MPSSRPNTIPSVIHLLRQLRPRSILDVGVGFGKWGHLFREYTDILEAENDPVRYRRENWQVRIDGIEGFSDYLTEMHRYLYNEIHVGDARVLIHALPAYDLIFLGDVLEHMSKAEGRQFLIEALDHVTKAVVLTTPKYETDQTELCGNKLEQHRSLWSGRDFRRFAGASVRTVDQTTLLAVLPKPGLPILKITPPRQPGAKAARKLLETRRALIELLPQGEPTILVDEEQFRTALPHRQLMPFLERDGKYWGPPADDATAIAELERLRAAGATHITFVWPCFWWLKHYSGLHQHLREKFICEVDNDQLVVFKLNRP